MAFHPGRASALALLAPLGAISFTLSWFVLGVVSPGYRMFDTVIDSYSAVSQPISGLGLGVTGPYMNTAFVVCGVCLAAGVLASARTWPHDGRPTLWRATSVLLALCGVGVALCGLFTLESVMLHSLGFLLALGAPAVGFVLAGLMLHRTDRLLSTWLLIAGPLTIGLLVLFLAVFDPSSAGDNEGVAGGIQRVAVTTALATVGLLGWRASRRSASAAPPAGKPDSVISVED